MPETFFAPAERMTPDELQELARQSLEDPIINVVLQSVGGYVLILNEQRQVLAANQEVLDALEIKELDSILGERPGVIFSCEHGNEAPAGCGTTRHCQACGAVLSIMAAQQTGLPADDECHLRVEKEGEFQCVDFRVRSTPLVLNGRKLLIFVLHDITAQKIRDVFEKVLFHDLRNMIGGLMGWSEMLDKNNPREAAARIVDICQMLNREVEDHYILFLAENKELTARPEKTSANQILETLKLFFANHSSARGKKCHMIQDVDDAEFTTDLTLMMRVMINMIKNALEATPREGRVLAWWNREDGAIVFKVKNDTIMPEDVQLRVFNRGFSTHQMHGRGLGTYSMRLLGEQYLGGKVAFHSSLPEGTTFSIRLPLVFAAKAQLPAAGG